MSSLGAGFKGPVPNTALKYGVFTAYGSYECNYPPKTFKAVETTFPAKGFSALAPEIRN